MTLSLCFLWAADQAREQKYQQAVDLFESKGDVKGAIKLFEEVAKSPDRNLAARSLLYLGSCYEKLGQDGAQKAYERIVKEFGDQPEVTAKARGRLAAIGGKRTETGVTATRIWGGPEYRQYTSISQDGHYATYVDSRANIHVHDLMTNETRKVVGSSAGWIDWPVYLSPEGKQIAYNTASPSGFGEFHVIGSDGSNDRLLARGKDMNAVPQAWAPDGKHVIARFRHAHGEPNGPVETVLVSVSDGSFKVISSGFLQSSQVSPDGRQIVFESPMDSKRSDIFLAPIEGGLRTLLVENAGIARSNPMWAPDGKRVLFLDDHRGGRDLWSIRVVDGKPEGSPELVKENLGFTETGAIPVGVSRSGDYYYNSSIGTSDLYTADIDPQTLGATSEPKNIGRYFNLAPAWSPDGEYLAYLSRRGPARNGNGYSLVIRSTKTGDERTVIPKMPLDLASFPGPQWFPDGRSLLVHASSWMAPAQTSRYYRIDVTTGEIEPLPGSAPMPYYATLAPDGRSIYYTLSSEETRQTRLLQRELRSVEEKELSVVNVQVYQLAVSPDGARLAFAADSNKLMILPAAGGEPTKVYEEPKGGRIGRPIWTKDGSRLLFAVGREVRSVAVGGGEARLVFEAFGGGPGSFDLRPDGKQFVFTSGNTKSEFWVLKNLFAVTGASH